MALAAPLGSVLGLPCPAFLRVSPRLVGCSSMQGDLRHPHLALPWRWLSPKPSAHSGGGVIPVVHHLCEHLLSWKSFSCITQESCRWEGWHCNTRCQHGRQLGAAGRATLMAEECDVPPWAAWQPVGRPSAASAAWPVHCSACRMTDEQAAWHAAALQLSVGPIQRSGGLVSSVVCSQMSSWVDHEALPGLSALLPDCN